MSFFFLGLNPFDDFLLKKVVPQYTVYIYIYI